MTVTTELTDGRAEPVLPAAKVYLTDLRAVETDQTCGRKLWLSRIEGGTGILKKDDVVPQLLDVALHSDLRALAKMEKMDQQTLTQVVADITSGLSAEDRQDIQKMELLYRRLGQLVAFGLFFEEGVRARFADVGVDPAITYDRDPLWVVVQPDRLLRDRTTNEVIYREYVGKPLGMTTEKWCQSWHYNIRLHLGMAALEQMGIKVNYAEAVGVDRGYRSHLDGRLAHPYVWCYHNKFTNEWLSPRERQGRAGDWETVPVWTFPGGIVAWVKQCGESIARSQFVVSPPVRLNQDIVNGWASQRLHRQREIEAQRERAKNNLHIREVYFPKETNQCSNPLGEPCPYLRCCWDKKVEDMPLKSGLFVPNSPAQFGEVLLNG